MAEKPRYQEGEGLPAKILDWNQQVVVNNERLAKFQRIVDGESKLSEAEEDEKRVVISIIAQLQSDIARAERELAESKKRNVIQNKL